MTITQIMAARRTVQIRTHRDTELHDVALVRGDQVEETFAWQLGTDESAELIAEILAQEYGLDVSRIDIP